MKKYTVQGTEYSEEEVEDYFSCKFCGTCITDAGTYMHEDQYGEYFCENKECAWEHINECESIEVESIEDTGEEEE